MRWSHLTLTRALFTSSILGAAAISCAQGSTYVGVYGTGGAGSTGPVTVTIGTGGSTSSSTSGFPSASSSSTSGFPSASSSSTSGFSTSSSGFSTSSSTSSGGPSSACDVGQCSDCSTCAQNGDCSNQTLTCELIDTDCYSIIDCINTNNCTDSTCVTDCENQYPAGAADFEALLQCLDCDCVQTCQVPAGVCP